MQFTDSLYKKLLDHVHDGIYFVDLNRTILYWNKGAEQITGYTAQEVVGSSCADNILTHVDEHGQELCHGLCPMLMTMGDTKDRHADIYLHHKDGHRIPVAVHVTPLHDEHGNLMGCMESFHKSPPSLDQHYIEELEKASMLDPLTQIANRRFLEMKLTSCFEEFRRYGIPFGVIFADIDRFKAVNDTFGHLVGDDVLKMTAKTLTQNIRATDLVGRWGGEEFLVIVTHLDLKNTEKLGEKLRRLIEKSFLSTRSTFVRVSMTFGVTTARPDDTTESLLHRADSLLYQGKEQGRNRVVAKP
jgi:diguanylate cyclase (GGDEF)-like protein/PAS domain S-box-containing protein